MASTNRKLMHLLAPAQKRGALVMLGLMLVGVVLETLGVGLVIPALALMTRADLGARYPWVAPWLVRLGNPTQEQLVIAGMLTLVGVSAIRCSYLTWLTWWQTKFVYSIQVELSQRIFAGYLRQPYAFHLQRNSALLVRNAMGQVDEITNVFIQGLNLSTEFMVLIGISVLLVAVEPIGALLVMTLLGAAGFAFSRLSRGPTLRWGAARQRHEALRLLHLQQGLGGAKDVKLLGRETEFLNQYRFHSVASAAVARRQTTMQALPRLSLELLSVMGLAGLVMVMMARGKAPDAILPALGLFAAAAFRLMPSVNRVLGALQSARFSLPAIDGLHAEVLLFGASEAPVHGPWLRFTSSLSLDGVSFQYPETERPSLHGVTLSIPRGASVGFIGDSGAGKSTLVDIILGLFTPTSGAVQLDGVDIQTNLRGWQDQLGYVPQSIFLTDDTLRRNIGFGLANDEIDEAAVWRAIHAAQLEPLIAELPQGLDTVVGERGIRLSGGQRQRIGIARALYHDPPVLVLDEATSALDTETERGVMDAVRALRGDKTLVIVAHRLSTVEHCDRLFRLEGGRLVGEGAPSVLLSTASAPGRSA